jgi:hypothetical protein
MASASNTHTTAQETAIHAANADSGTNTPPAEKTPSDAQKGGNEAATKKTLDEITYSANELANASRARFGVLPEVVLAAFKMKGIKEATIPEARKIVKAFMERTVD